MGRPLTARQQQVYDFIYEKISLRGYGPTVREIGEYLGIKSPNGVMCHLRALERKGMIHRMANKSRAIELTNRKPREKQVDLNVLGEISLGECNLFEVPRSSDVLGMLEHPERFLLQYNGDDLRDWAIARGDILVVQHASVNIAGSLELVRNNGGLIELRAPSQMCLDSVTVATNSSLDDAGRSISSCGIGRGHGGINQDACIPIELARSENTKHEPKIRIDAPDGNDQSPAIQAMPCEQIIGVVVGLVRTQLEAQTLTGTRPHFSSVRVV